MRGKGEAHFIPRSHGGLGIEQNLLTVCRPCHDLLDNSTKRKEMLQAAEQYLRSIYPGWDKESLIYKKGMETKADNVQKIRNSVTMRDKAISQSKNLDLTKPPDGFWFIE